LEFEDVFEKIELSILTNEYQSFWCGCLLFPSFKILNVKALRCETHQSEYMHVKSGMGLQFEQALNSKFLGPETRGKACFTGKKLS
jgi:hypothetical protein